MFFSCLVKGGASQRGSRTDRQHLIKSGSRSWIICLKWRVNKLWRALWAARSEIPSKSPNVTYLTGSRVNILLLCVLSRGSGSDVKAPLLCNLSCFSFHLMVVYPNVKTNSIIWEITLYIWGCDPEKSLLFITNLDFFFHADNLPPVNYPINVRLCLFSAWLKNVSKNQEKCLNLHLKLRWEKK